MSPTLFSFFLFLSPFYPSFCLFLSSSSSSFLTSNHRSLLYNEKGLWIFGIIYTRYSPLLSLLSLLTSSNPIITSHYLGWCLTTPYQNRKVIRHRCMDIVFLFFIFYFLQMSDPALGGAMGCRRARSSCAHASTNTQPPSCVLVTVSLRYNRMRREGE